MATDRNIRKSIHQRVNKQTNQQTNKEETVKVTELTQNSIFINWMASADLSNWAILDLIGSKLDSAWNISVEINSNQTSISWSMKIGSNFDSFTQNWLNLVAKCEFYYLQIATLNQRKLVELTRIWFRIWIFCPKIQKIGWKIEPKFK